MLKISEIIKKYKEEKNKLHSSGTGDSTAVASTTDGTVKLAEIVDKTNTDIDSEEISQLYDEIVLKVRQVYRQGVGDKELLTPRFIPEVNGLIQKIQDFLNIDYKAFLIMCLADYPKKEDFFYYHVANVCGISYYIGLTMQYSPLRLSELGISAFLHDIGMLDFWDMVNKESRFNADEYTSVKTHSQRGAGILRAYGDMFSAPIISAIEQEHERMDGSGYPLGLKLEKISEEARIIGLIDMYEALMHSRPYRPKYTSLDTIKIILEHKSMFDQKIVKTVLEKIGIFPVGTLVRLNTKESGMVIKPNHRLPLRPVVNILFDAMGKELVQSKPVDLADNSMLYIEECLNEFPERES